MRDGREGETERKMFGFIKDDLEDAPGKVGVAIVQKDDGAEYGELVSFRLCADWHEVNAYLVSYGIDPTPVWTRQSPPTDALSSSGGAK